MKTYTPTIGLEIHAELSTRTKMFCECRNDPNEKVPNVNICPICLAHPGTLPVINKKAVESILKIGLAVGGKLADFSEFDRKNYFYPDIPKNYQISQYKYPLVSGGELAGVSITRVHLEEDTARSSHSDDGSLIDYNRAGVPLMELVTEPVIKNSEDAVKFAKELQLLLRTVGVAEANMEKGEMRVEANVSVSADQNFGIKVEVKNLNSFKVVGKAIEYEIKRQIEALEKGEKLVQETRGFNENTGETFPQRKKESSHDYRYFPDPDLPKLQITEIEEFSEANLREGLPELPSEKRNRFANDYAIKKEDADMYVSDLELGKLFESAAKALRTDDEIRLVSNYISSDLMGLVSASGERPMHIFGDPQKSGDSIAKLIKLISTGVVSSRGAKDILREFFEKGGDPERIAGEKNLFQESDEGAIKKVLEKVVVANEQVVKEYKGGKATALQYLIGQAMKESKGSGNPKVIERLLKEILG